MSVEAVANTITEAKSLQTDHIQPEARRAEELSREMKHATGLPEAELAAAAIRTLFASLRSRLDGVGANDLRDTSERAAALHAQALSGSSQDPRALVQSARPTVNPAYAVSNDANSLAMVAGHAREAIDQGEALLLATLGTVLGAVAAHGTAMTSSAEGVNLHSQYAVLAADEYIAGLQGEASAA